MSGREPSPPTLPTDPPARRTTFEETGHVLRSTVFLVAAQFVSTPLSMVVNAVLARHLGAGDFGTVYLATNIATLSFLLVDWGQASALPVAIARRPWAAPRLLGSGLAFRIGAAMLAFLATQMAAWLAGYPPAVRVALALVVAQSTVATMTLACSATLRGFERIAQVAGIQMAAGTFNALLVIPVVAAGGGLSGALFAQIAAATATLGFASWLIFRLRIGRLLVSREGLREVLSTGSGFVALGVVLALQPNIDAVMLSKLAPAQVIGWHGAATKVVGILIFPATTLSAAFYPTLARLFGEDRSAFLHLSRLGYELMLLLGVPAAVGTLLFADPIVTIAFGRSGFAPAGDNLRVLSLFVLLVYLNILSGVVLAAAGREKSWATAQLLCLVISVIFDPILIPLLQAKAGNGGLGVCLAIVASEMCMTASAVALLPRSMLDRHVLGCGLRVLAGGAAMLAAGALLSRWSVVAGVAGSVLVYLAVVNAIGGILAEHREMGRKLLRSAFGRRAG